MQAPDKLYLSPVIYGTITNISPNPDCEGEVEYVRKDALIKWAWELNETYHKEYEESNYTCGEHWGQMVAFQKIIDKLNSM